MWTYFIIALGMGFVVAIYVSDRFRGVTHEMAERWAIPFLKYGWPYAAIYAAYDLISSGALGNLIRTLLSSTQ